MPDIPDVSELDVPDEQKEDIERALREEAAHEHGNVQQLWQALKDGVGLIAEVGPDILSGVDVPAIDSEWVMLKDDDGQRYVKQAITKDAPVLVDKDEEQRISMAPAMIPRETDKEGDVVSTPDVERAAHYYLKEGRGIDVDHNLIEGKGDVVESWILDQERTYTMPDGTEKAYPPGTWMTKVEWGPEAWERVKSGDITGLSIYGMAEYVPVGKELSTEDLIELCEQRGLSVTKSDDPPSIKSDADIQTDMGEEPEEETPDPLETVKAEIEELRSELAEKDRSASELINELAETLANSEDYAFSEKSEAKDAIESALTDDKELTELAEGVFAETEKQVEASTVIDVVAALTPDDVGADEIAEAIGGLMEAENDDDEEDEEAQGDPDRRDADAEKGLSKGFDGRETAAEGVKEETEKSAAGNPLANRNAAAEQWGAN